DVAGGTHSDDAADALDVLDRLDLALEQPEEGPFAALVRRIFARGEADVAGGPRDPLAIRLAQRGEDGDACDLLCRHHRPQRYPFRAAPRSPTDSARRRDAAAGLW